MNDEIKGTQLFIELVQFTYDDISVDDTTLKIIKVQACAISDVDYIEVTFREHFSIVSSPDREFVVRLPFHELQKRKNSVEQFINYLKEELIKQRGGK